MTLRHQCPQNGCYKDTLPDWAILDGCFPRGISPSDVDGIIEMNEHVLMLEWKPLGAEMKTGQHLLFHNMTRGSPKVQVLVIYGAIGMPAEIELYQGGQRRFRQACDLAFLRWFCTQWSILVEQPVSDGPHLRGIAAELRLAPRRSSDRGVPAQLPLLSDKRAYRDRRAAGAEG